MKAGRQPGELQYECAIAVRPELALINSRTICFFVSICFSVALRI